MVFAEAHIDHSYLNGELVDKTTERNFQTIVNYMGNPRLLLAPMFLLLSVTFLIHNPSNSWIHEIHELKSVLSSGKFYNTQKTFPSPIAYLQSNTLFSQVWINSIAKENNAFTVTALSGGEFITNSVTMMIFFLQGKLLCFPLYDSVAGTAPGSQFVGTGRRNKRSWKKTRN